MGAGGAGRGGGRSRGSKTGSETQGSKTGCRSGGFSSGRPTSVSRTMGGGHQDLRSVLSSSVQQPRAQAQLGAPWFGMGGNSGGGIVKSEGLVAGNFVQGSGNSSTVTDGGLFFWATAPCTYGSCLLKPPDPFPGSGGSNDPGSGSGSSAESERREREREKAFRGVRREGEPPPLKRATRSSTHTGSRKQEEEGIAGCGGRLGRSASLGNGFSMESRTTSSLPFYRSPSLFAKPPTRLWIEPLQFLLKKELTVTDVGELGRIILPKRDAECQLPHLDSKEGKLLTMEDYNSNKQWTLRYKWWPNNKSRMYVLESTGEFVKYHDLKEKDELFLYRDTCNILVINGVKKNTPVRESGSALGPTSFKGKSTGKRSPKAPNVRNIYKNGSPTASSSNSAQASNSNHQSLDSPYEHESPDGLDFKLGLANPSQQLVPHPTQALQPKLSLDGGLLSGSVLSTSVMSTSVLQCHVDQSDITPIALGSYPSAAGHSDGAIDWEKLPDLPVNLIEFLDPAAIEFPAGEFEGNWAEFN